MAVYPTVIDVGVRDKLRVNLKFRYRGPSYGETIYAALWKGYVFGHPDETAGVAKGITIPKCDVESEISGGEFYLVITIPDRPGEIFGLYAKVGPVECSPADRYASCVRVAGVAVPEISNVEITSYIKV